MTAEAADDPLEAQRLATLPFASAGGVLGLGVAFVIFLFVFVMLPVSRSYPTTPDRVDALVVLAGSNGDRLAYGLKMADAGVSDTLVLNTGIDWEGQVADRVAVLCRDGHPQHTILCVSALPDSTKGEAQTIAKLADQRGLTSLGIVTSEFHMHRSLRWFERCLDADISAVAVPGTSGSVTNRSELISSAHALLIDRSCFPS